VTWLIEVRIYYWGYQLSVIGLFDRLKIVLNAGVPIKVNKCGENPLILSETFGMKAKHFKFENRSKALLPFDQFLKRAIRFALYSLVLVVFSVGLGTIGYKYFGHLSSMILTGMGPVSEMPDNTGKIFASFYALFSGIAFLTTVAVLFAPIAHRFLHVLHIDEE
jgi:hypothetical protein